MNNRHIGNYTALSRYIAVYGTLRSEFAGNKNYFLNQHKIKYKSLGTFKLKGLELHVQDKPYPLGVISDREDAYAVVEILDLNPDGFDLFTMYQANLKLDMYEVVPFLYRTCLFYPVLPVLGTTEVKIYLYTRPIPQSSSSTIITDYYYPDIKINNVEKKETSEEKLYNAENLFTLHI